jgi:hypothetical protein
MDAAIERCPVFNKAHQQLRAAERVKAGVLRDLEKCKDDYEAQRLYTQQGEANDRIRDAQRELEKLKHGDDTNATDTRAAAL